MQGDVMADCFNHLFASLHAFNIHYLAITESLDRSSTINADMFLQVQRFPIFLGVPVPPTQLCTAVTKPSYMQHYYLLLISTQDISHDLTLDKVKGNFVK